MPRAHTVNGSRWEELDRSEMTAELEEQAQRLVGMSLSEFIDKYRAGELADHPAVDYLAIATGATSARRPSRT